MKCLCFFFSNRKKSFYKGESGNVSLLIEKLLHGYDQRLRPNYKGNKHLSPYLFSLAIGNNIDKNNNNNELFQVTRLKLGLQCTCQASVRYLKWIWWVFRQITLLTYFKFESKLMNSWFQNWFDATDNLIWSNKIFNFSFWIQLNKCCTRFWDTVHYSK